MGRVDKVKQSTSGVTWSRNKLNHLQYNCNFYKLSKSEAGVDYMQLLDVLVPVSKLFQISILCEFNDILGNAGMDIESI